MTQSSPQIVDGETLSSYLARGGNLPATDALGLMDVVARRVAELHAGGSLHLPIDRSSIARMSAKH